MLDKNKLQTMKDGSALSKGQNPLTTKDAEVWVKKWVDYSSKYGLGYLLSSNATGVFFNDSTKIVLDTDQHKFFYYERKAVTQTEKQDVMSSYTLSEYPKEL